MAEHPVDIVSGSRRLSGSLRLPDGPAGPAVAPAALLLPGSGPIDRDGDHRRLPLGISRRLAEALAGAGVASLRYDRRGVGSSDGDFLATGFFDNVDDAAAALRKLAATPEVDPARLFLIGHSEGALTATALAARLTARPGDPAPAGLVFLAGAARPGEQTLRWQAARLAPTLPAPVRAVLRISRTDLVAKVARNHERIRATTTDVARVGLQRINARWFREFLDYDPRPDLARIGAPVLAVTGDKDLQVDPADAPEIARLVRGGSEARVLTDVTHVLRRQPGPPSLKAYRAQARRPLDEELVELVLGWLRRHAR